MTCFSFIFKRIGCSGQQSDQHLEDIPGIENVRIYSYKELRNATGDFSLTNKVGEGGFGSVYKGKLKDGKIVAVKVLSSESRQGVPEFLNEIAVISGSGCSNIQFNWRTRVRICIGVARGLAFLHEEVRPHIVHRDIKASNILLDKDLTPKISDFGLAKLLPPNITHVSTRVAGTIGYLAPEYAIKGQVNRKSDVYSFGVLLLEIVTGRCNTNTRLPYDEQFLLERTWNLYEHGEIANIIDTSLTDDLDVDEACKFLKVGLLCTQDTVKLRPSMSTVARMLTDEKDVNLEKITKPGLLSDLMELKVRSQNNVNDPHTSSLVTSGHGSSPLSSENTTHASMTFTVISD
ncbi:cold-responsive protein kinase 1 isoform X3 [Musa acuminata AAA Group]|uniref:cold-responsive protein kinase 1-like isoform X3 n=1 Tax=Musa acuminata AAA Group TaxID=214697 RepID=UPI0031DBD30D